MSYFNILFEIAGGELLILATSHYQRKVHFGGCDWSKCKYCDCQRKKGSIFVVHGQNNQLVWPNKRNICLSLGLKD